MSATPPPSPLSAASSSSPSPSSSPLASSGDAGSSNQPMQTTTVTMSSNSTSSDTQSIPSQAASNLYLYTFLATLVLLLCVSGAVVLRSITLRIRHRRAIEEAIRNGTYVPPDQRPRKTPPVRPAMHDAHVEEETFDGEDSEKMKWEGLMPIAVTFVPSPDATALAHSSDQSPRPPHSRFALLRSSSPFHLPNILGDLLPQSSQSDTRQLGRSDEAAIAPGSTSIAPRPQSHSPPHTPVKDAGDAGNTGTQPQSQPQPAAVRVAFLIAMPDPARARRDRTSRASSSSPTLLFSEPDSSSLVKGKARDSTMSENSGSGNEREHVRGRRVDGAEDSNGELPYVEFGVAEVPIRAAPLSNKGDLLAPVPSNRSSDTAEQSIVEDGSPER